MSRVRTMTVAAGTALTIAFAPAAMSAAAPTPPAAPTLSFSVPAISGVELPPASVPAGSFAPVTVTAKPALKTMQFPPPPSAVTFTADVAPYHYQYAYRHLLVSWHNLTTGKTGELRLRHWQLPDYETSSEHKDLPTSANAPTGAGVVVATVTVLRDQYNAAPTPINILPGVNAISVP